MEFLVCAGLTDQASVRIGFIIITFLPPTGLYLSIKIADLDRPEVILYFLAGLLFSIYFAIIPESVVLMDCNPLYAVYFYGQSIIYGLYYYFTIAVGMYLLVYHLYTERQGNRDDFLLLLGYLAFLLPIGLMSLFDPTITSAVPSIMCKYAFSLALILAFMALKRSS